ncbi:unnamed protein product [Moneuplotes crassus]|uniref:Uncharacterized protein n=1 Tax=Euplotes crassus TaxID=5936 RepID=A0AAD1Y3N1_EUPCR|nr:unnamed protein product [Moneuplotes crassus]
MLKSRGATDLKSGTGSSRYRVMTLSKYLRIIEVVPRNFGKCRDPANRAQCLEWRKLQSILTKIF